MFVTVTFNLMPGLVYYLKTDKTRTDSGTHARTHTHTHAQTRVKAGACQPYQN